MGVPAIDVSDDATKVGLPNRDKDVLPKGLKNMNRPKDLQKQYIHLAKLPFNVMLIILFLLVLLTDEQIIKSFIYRNGAVWFGVIGLGVFCVDYIAQRLINPTMLQKYFTPTQLTHANRLAQGLTYVAIVAFIVMAVMLKSIIKS